MDHPPARPHQSALRRGRSSIPGATYFLTICAQRPCDGLACGKVFLAMLDRCNALRGNDSWKLHALVLQPDHVHLLGKLGQIDSLGEIVRKLKGPLTPTLRNIGLQWQPGGYFDRRVRDAEELSRILRYMLTNPYRKGLLSWDEVWPWWYCDPEVWRWFEPTTNAGKPYPEWARERSPGREAGA